MSRNAFYACAKEIEEREDMQHIIRDERKAALMFEAINRIAHTDSRYGVQMRDIASQVFDEVTQ